MRILRRLVLVAFALTVGSFVLPAAVGGATGYVRSYGNSMEPLFHAGDLAVVRTARSYGIGDVVAYRSPQLDRVVLHRIVALDGAAFVFQGDNNGHRDAEHLGAEHILGRLTLRVPRGGTAVVWLTNPLIAVGVAVGAAILPAAFVTRRRRRPHHHTSTRGVPMSTITTIPFRKLVPWVAATGAAFLVVGGVASSRPVSQWVDKPVTFTQTGSFTYSAPSSAPLYPEGFTTGDPIFTRLADRVIVGFAHRVDSEATMAVDGTLRVDAVLSGSGGWTRSLPLLGPRPLGRDGTNVEVELDLPALRALGAEGDAITGTAEGELGIALTPIIDFGGTVARQHVAGRFNPVLAFTLDAAALRLATANAADVDRFTHTQARTVHASVSRPRHLPLPLLGRHLTVATARTGGFAAGGALLVLAAALAFANRRRDDSEPARIVARYGHLLVPIHAVRSDDRPVVDVPTIGDLARVAKHHDQLLLHHISGDSDTYLVQVPGTTYQYRSSERSSSAGAPATD